MASRGWAEALERERADWERKERKQEEKTQQKYIQQAREGTAGGPRLPPGPAA